MSVFPRNACQREEVSGYSGVTYFRRHVFNQMFTCRSESENILSFFRQFVNRKSGHPESGNGRGSSDRCCIVIIIISSIGIVTIIINIVIIIDWCNMCYDVLCCAVLYSAALCCDVLYCTVLCCTVLCCTLLYCAVLCCTVLYCAVLYCTVLY